MDDDQVLKEMLNIRSFKEIHNSLTKKRSREEIEEEIKSSKPILKEKRFKTHHDVYEVQS